MKQPKFKFGDKVELINSFTIFTISNIYFNLAQTHYHYSSDSASFAHREDELKLYVEPPRIKKVYQFLFKLEGMQPTLGYDLWDSEQQFREHLFDLNRKSSIEYIKLANTFEVPE